MMGGGGDGHLRELKTVEEKKARAVSAGNTSEEFKNMTLLYFLHVCRIACYCPTDHWFLFLVFKLFIIRISLNRFYCLVFKSTDLFFYPLNVSPQTLHFIHF